MTEALFWTNWLDEAPSKFIIIVLVALNIIMACWAVTQRRRRNKLEREILAEKTLGATTPFASKQPFSKTPRPKNGFFEVGPLLKIDQAIKMVKNGYSLEETKSEIDIETAYLQIIAKHHQNN